MLVAINVKSNDSYNKQWHSEIMPVTIVASILIAVIVLVIAIYTCLKMKKI